MKPYRAKQQARLAEKTATMLQEAQLLPKAVRPKLLLTIFDNAGIEDDEDLHTMWAALLANAAVQAGSEIEISPAFPEVLRQLSPTDALLMKSLFEIAQEEQFPSMNVGMWLDLCRRVPLTPDQISVSLQHLLHHYLIETDQTLLRKSGHGGTIVEEKVTSFKITPFGGMFVHACQAPRKK